MGKPATEGGGQLRRSALNLSVEIKASSSSPDAASSPSSSARGQLSLRLPSLSPGARVSPTATLTADSTLDPRSPGLARTPLSTRVSDVNSPDDEASTGKEPVDPRSPGVERTPVPGVQDDADNIRKLGGRLTPVDSLQLLTQAQSRQLVGSSSADGWSKLRQYTRGSTELQRDINRNKTLLGLSVKEVMHRMKEAAIQMRSQSRFLILETSKLRIRWDMCQFFVLVYVALTVPIRIGFSVEAEGLLYSLELLIELYFWVDIGFNFFTTYVDEDRVVVTELKKIRSRYFRTWFLLDILSVTPLDLLLRITAGRMPCSFFLEGCSGTVRNANSSGQFVKLFKMLRLIRLLKLLRLMRLDRLFERYKDELFFFLRMFTVMRLVIMLLYLGHLFGCLFYYFSSDFFRTTAEKALARDGMLFTWLDQEDGVTLSEKYVASVYWSFTTMTTVGYGDISAKTIAERVFAIIGMLMGGFVLSAIISKLILVVEEADLGKKAMKKKLVMVEEWVKDLHLPKTHRVRVLNHFRNQAHKPYDSAGLLMMLPFDLRECVCSHQYGDILDAVPFFADGGAVFRAEIATLFTERLVLTGCRVYEKGEVGLELFVLREGTVDLLDPSIPAGASVLSRGAYFGEGMLVGDECRQESVVVRMNAQLLVLQAGVLQPIMDRNPAILQMIRTIYLKRRSILKCNSRRELERRSLEQGGDDTETEKNGEERRGGSEGLAVTSMFSSEEALSPRSMRRVSFEDEIEVAEPSSTMAAVQELLLRQAKVEKSVERLERHIGGQLRGIQAALAGIEARLGAQQASSPTSKACTQGAETVPL